MHVHAWNEMYSVEAFKFLTRTSGHPKRHFYELLQFDFTSLVGPESLFQFFVMAFQYSARVLGCVLYIQTEITIFVLNGVQFLRATSLA